MARTLMLTVAALVLLLVAAVLAVSLFLDKERIVALAARAVEEQTGATLTITGDLELTVFPVVGVAFGGASLTMPGNTDPDLEIGSANIGVQLRPLFSGEVAIDTIAVDGLTARITAAPTEQRVDTSGFSDAELDAWYAERRSARTAAGDAAGAQAALAVPLALNVSSLRVTNARLESLDAQSGELSVAELRSLEASDLNLAGDPIPLSLRLHLPGDAPLDVALAGSVALSQGEDQLSFQDLRVDVTGATAEPLALVASGRAHIARQSADVDLQITLGAMTGGGSLRYASFESPMIDANLALNLLDPALLALAGPEAAAETSDTPPASGDEPLPLDAIRAIDTKAVLQIDEARFGAHTVENLGLRLRAVEGVVTVSDLSGSLHGGQLAATATLDGRHNTALLKTSGGLEAMDLTRALAAAGSPDTLSGTGSLDWQLESRGRNVNQLTAALDGPLTVSTAEVVLQGISVERLVCQAVALTNNERLTSTFDPDTRLTTLSANIDIADGKAVLRPLRAELAHIALAGSGNFDLLAQDFDATFRGRLSPGLEELDRACRVSKRLTAIDFPVNCRGNVAGAPADWCKVDTEKILTDLAVNEGRRKIEKEAGKLFNRFLGGGKREQGEKP